MSKMTMPEPDEIDVLWLDEGNREWLDGKECSVLGEHEFRALLEAYAAAKVREAQQWQPIETAPKDGTAILIGNERGAWIAKYEPVHPSGYRPANPWFSLMLNHNHMHKGKPFGPTHWMPLPAPPLPGPVEP